MLSQDLGGAVTLLAYYIAFALLLGLLTRFFDIPREWLRKSYHVFCSLSILILLLCFDNWYAAVLAISLLLLAGYVILLLSKHFPFAATAIDRGNGVGEIRLHLLLLLLSFVVLLTVFWGLLGETYQYAAALGLLAWGFGDAAAAVLGSHYGRRRLRSPIFDPAKTVLGTWAMAIASAAIAVAVLRGMTDLDWIATLLAAILIGIVAALVEAVTRRGLDTLSIPLVVAFLAAPIVIGAARLTGGAF